MVGINDFRLGGANIFHSMLPLSISFCNLNLHELKLRLVQAHKRTVIGHTVVYLNDIISSY